MSHHPEPESWITLPPSQVIFTQLTHLLFFGSHDRALLSTMAYPSPSSLSPTSTLSVEVEDDHPEQLTHLPPRHRPSSPVTLPEPKRSRTALPKTIIESTSLQAWLNAVSTSPLPPPAHQLNPLLQLDRIDTPICLQLEQPSISDSYSGLKPNDVVKFDHLASSASSHPTPAATPQPSRSSSSSSGDDLPSAARLPSSLASTCSSVPHDASSKDRFVAGLVGE